MNVIRVFNSHLCCHDSSKKTCHWFYYTGSNNFKMCQKVVKLYTTNGSFYRVLFTVWRTTSLLYDWWCCLLCSTQYSNKKILPVIMHVTPSNIKWCFTCNTESRLHSLFYIIWLYDFEILFIQNDDKICTQLQKQVKMDSKHPQPLHRLNSLACCEITKPEYKLYK
jgi:hypothetical protein